jgi:hypothetical protein
MQVEEEWNSFRNQKIPHKKKLIQLIQKNLIDASVSIVLFKDRMVSNCLFLYRMQNYSIFLEHSEIDQNYL